MDAYLQDVYSREIKKIVRGAGTGATATAALKANGGLRSVTVNAGGSGYAVNDVLDVGAGGGKIKVTAVDGSGAVTDVTITVAGTTYSASAEDVATTNGNGTGCKVNTIIEKEINAVTVSAGGTGYVSAIARFTGGGNNGWKDGTVTITSGAVTAITAPANTTYTSIPTIVIIAGGPTTTNDFIDAISAYEASSKNVRYKDILRNFTETERLTADQADIVTQTYNSLV